MPEYMLLLYGPQVDEAGQAARWAELPLWQAVTDSLRDAGLLVANGPLHPVTSATTVRVRDGEVELTDGPFAVTKEVLAGYYILNCTDLDEALKSAARLPIAEYGSVEVRPIMDLGAPPVPDQEETDQDGTGQEATDQDGTEQQTTGQSGTEGANGRR